MDPGWWEQVIPELWTEGGSFLVTLDGWRGKGLHGTLDGGRRYSMGVWMEGGDTPWDPGKGRINLPLINDIGTGG